MKTILYLTMKVVFECIGSIWSNIVVIDKTKMVILTKVIKEDTTSWDNVQIGGIQTKC